MTEYSMITSLQDRMTALEAIVAAMHEDAAGSTPEEFMKLLDFAGNAAAEARKASLDDRLKKLRAKSGVT